MKNRGRALSPLVTVSAALMLAGCGSNKSAMPVTPMPGGAAAGAGPQSPAPTGTGVTPAGAPPVKPR